MRALFLAAILLLAGCLSEGASDDEPTCPCEVLVEGGPVRAFEPDIGIDPTDPDHWVIASVGFRTLGEGGHPDDMRTHVTFDAGRTWTTSAFPGDVPPTHPLGHYDLTGDPAVAFLDDGTVLVAGMGATSADAREAAGVQPFRPFDVFVARSTDGGLTWPEAAILARGSGLMGALGPASQGVFLAGEWMDRPWIATGEGELVLAVWQSRVATGGGPHTATALTSVSRDGGRTWTEPVVVREEGRSGTARPAIAPDGTMWLAFRDHTEEDRTVWTAWSKDGASWEVAQVPEFLTQRFLDVAVAEDAMHLVVVPHEENEVETPRLMSSYDRGATWRAVDLERGEAPGWSIPRVVARPGLAVVSYYHALPDGTNERRAAFVDPEGGIRTVTLSTSPIGPSDMSAGWPTYGEFVGMDATEAGIAAAWVGGTKPELDLFAAWLPWE